MKTATRWIFVLAVSVWSTAYSAGQILDIVVDKSKFSEVYPAVWFSPATGEIVSIKERSERPPDEKYEIWIEPNDPEFGFLVDQSKAEAQKIGFALIGKGVEVFEKTESWHATKLDRKLTHLMKEAQGTDGLVFYCRGRKSACLIMITQMDTKKDTISFRWRPLANQQR